MTRTTRARTWVVAASLLFALVNIAASTPTYIPVVNGQFSVGQWYFEGEKSALGGNAGLTFIPALRFTNRLSLIPTVETNYRGTRSAEELAGGTNLFQDTWENGVALKAVHGLSRDWNLKERLGFRSKWFRETTDETWNHGLYDYRIYNAGAEIERHWDKIVSISLSYDYSFLAFPNYVSLESTQGGDLAREFAGNKVLDEHIHLFSLTAQSPLFWKMNMQAQIFYSPRSYTSQNVVDITSQLTATRRKDLFEGETIALDRSFDTTRRSNLFISLQVGRTTMNSNQNHYDAGNNTFVPNFYDYKQNNLGLQLTLAVGKKGGLPMLFDVGASISKRTYIDRVIQDADTTYLNDKLHSTDTSLNLGYSYPLSKNFRLHVTSTFGESSSNNHYEAVYRYNYTDSNYQFGFTYDY